MLSGSGMSLNDLSGFAECLKEIAQHHGIRPGVLCNQLIGELEQLDKGLGLETILQTKRNELSKMKRPS